MRKSTIFYSILILVVSSIFFMGCNTADKVGEESNSSKEKPGQSAVFADTQCPTNLDPAVSWNSWYTSRYGITETLFKLDGQLVAQPFLAASYRSIDPTTWEIILRDDVKFQNGKKMTADSVKRSWDRTMEINPRLNELLFITSIKTKGQTLTIKTSKPVPAFISCLSEPLSGVIDVDSGKAFETSPVGTGPFCADAYVVKKEAKVKRNEQYWGGKPALESVTFKIIASPSALAMAQQTGECQLSVSIPATSLSLFSDSSKYRIDGVPGSRGQVIFINHENMFLKDINVRRAISMAIDKKACAEILNKGASIPANALFPDFMAFGGKGLKGYDYDLEGARQLLSQAGYQDLDGDGILEKDGKNIDLEIVTYSTKAELPSLCQELSSKLKEIGIRLRVEVYESVSAYQRGADFDLMMISFTMAPTGDPQYFCDIAFKTEGSANYGHYSNPGVDDLIDRLDKEFDVEKRVEYARKIQQKILDDAGYIVVGHAKFINVMGIDLKDFKTNPSEYYLLDHRVALGAE